MSKLGEYGYAPPTDAIGLNGLFPKLGDGQEVEGPRQDDVHYNPAVARSILTGNGFRYSGNRLIDPHGDRVELDIHVIAGWSDWVASNQIITRNLRDIGIDSNVELEPDWGAWQPNAYATKFPTLLWQAASQGSPYGYFYSNLSQNAYVPPGQSGETTGNWSHFADPKATRPLNQWKVTLNETKQQQARHAAAGDLPRRPADRAPLHRPALVDLQHQVLPLLRDEEELLRRSDLHDVPRQHPVVHPDLPGWQGRPLRAS